MRASPIQGMLLRSGHENCAMAWVSTYLVEEEEDIMYFDWTICPTSNRPTLFLT